jgi:hypothetical protein
MLVRLSTTDPVATEAEPAKQRRMLRRLLRDLVAFTGASINELATPRRAAQPERNRLLYRRADTLTDSDLDRLVAEIGATRLMAALDRLTKPELFSAVA